MASEVAVASLISMDMQQAALVAGNAAGQLAEIDLREQWQSDAAVSAQVTLRHHQRDIGALARAAGEANRLAQESISALVALQQAGKL